MPKKPNKQQSSDLPPIDIVGKLDFKREQAAEFKNQYTGERDEATNFYRGNQWKRGIRKPFKNVVFSTIETEVPILNDSQPGVDVMPIDEEKSLQAEQLDAAMRWTYDFNNLDMRRSQAVRSSLIRGDGWLYVDYDPDMSNGEGEVTIRNIPDELIFLDPTASLIDEAAYACIISPQRKEELDRKYGAKAKEIMPGGGSGLKDTVKSILDGTYFEQKWTPAASGTSESKSRYDAKDIVFVEEHWVKDYTLENIPEDETEEEIRKEIAQFNNGENPDVFKWENHAAHIGAHEGQLQDFQAQIDEIAAQALNVPVDLLTDADRQALLDDPEIGPQFEQIQLTIEIIKDHIRMHEIWLDENPKNKRPKYPKNWRLVIKVEDTVLYDDAPPVSDGMIPLVPIYCYKEESSIWGFGEARNIIPVQKSLNEMDWMELQGLRLNSNSGWVYDIQSGLSPHNFNNEQGIILGKVQGTEVRRLDPAQVSPQFANRKQEDIQFIQTISGINEFTQGKVPNQIQADAAIARLQSQSVGRIREKARYLDRSMLRLGWLVASRIVKYWSNERKLRVFDADGRIKSVIFKPEEIESLRYEVRLAPGSTNIGNKQAQFDLFGEMLLKGMITPQMFFKVYEGPKKNQLQDMVEENDEQAAMLQQLMAENEQMKAILQESGLIPGEEGAPADGQGPGGTLQAIGGGAG